MAAKDATTLSAFATWVGIINEHRINYSQDDSNADNQDACLNKSSKTLGQCILDCNDDSSCETACVSAFKDEHSECPCQVYYGIHQNVFLYFFIGEMPTRMPMWQLWLWVAWKEGDFDTLFGKFFETASTYSAKWLVFNFDFFNNFI